MIDDSTQYIARISYGKDSLKMLEVIRSRGLPLDRITTTDVWATDTISANLPPMDAFKARMDQWIWDHYHIEVEHLCARNPDGTKRTYEQMFYHIPVRRSQSLNVERERDRRTGCKVMSQVSRLTPDITGAKSSKLFVMKSGDSQCLEQSGVKALLREVRNQGFPAQISPWCRKLKIDKVKTSFLIARPDGRIEISWNI